MTFAKVVHGELHRLEPVVGPNRMEVHLALRPGLVPDPPKELRKRTVIAKRKTRSAVPGEPERRSALSRHDRGSTRHTDRAIGVGILIANPLIAQPVEMRSVDE